MGKISDLDASRLGLSPAARDLHERALVIDLHVDCILQQRFFSYDLRREHRPGTLVLAERSARTLAFDLVRFGAWLGGGDHPLFNHADIPRMQRAGYNGVGLGLHYWPVQREAGWHEIERQLDYFEELLAQEPQLALAGSPHALRQAAAEGKLAAFVALEGLHALGAKDRGDRRLARIEHLYRRGVRYITLAHLGSNDAVSNCYGPGARRDRGLSSFGREVVAEMNRLGMLIDVSHVSHQGVLDVCEASKAPVIASHTAFDGRSDLAHARWRARCLEDEALLAIAATGGVAAIFLAPQFLAGGPCPLGVVADQLRYGSAVLSAAGFDPERHFALGSDFDGWIASIPEPMQDIADMPLLTQTLLEGELGPTLVRNLLGVNFLRVWQQAQGLEVCGASR